MNINTLNVGKNNDKIVLNTIEQEKKEIIDTTKIETQAVLETPLEKLEIIA